MFPLFSIKDYPKITICISLIVCIISIIAETPFSDKFIPGAFAVVTCALMIPYAILSCSAIAGLYKALNDKEECISEVANDVNFAIKSKHLKELAESCIKLDKYGVPYVINVMNNEIHAELTMGMYTRMSVANNLDSNVFYHITGTDIVLTKNNKDTNVQ